MNIDNDFIDTNTNEVSIEAIKNALIANENDINEAKSELAKIDDTDIALTPGNSNVDIVLKNIYAGINKKYNLDISYPDFQTFLKGIVDESTTNLALESLVGKKITESVIVRTRVKMIATLGVLFDRVLELSIKKMQITKTIDPELVGLTDKIFNWYAQLGSELGSGYGDIDATIKNTVESQNKNLSQKVNNVQIDLINQIVNSLNNKGS